MTDSGTTLPHLAAGIPANYDNFLLARRYRLVAPYLPPDGGTLLDFGCGNGAQTFSFISHFSLTCGVDIDSQFLAQFRKQAVARGLTEKVSIQQYDGAAIPLGDDSIDCAMSFTVLEHVVDQAQALGELARVVKPGGTLVISVPNRWWIFETHGADLPLLPWNRVPFVSWWPRSLHDRYARARIYEKEKITGLIAGAGFSIEDSFYLTAPMDMLTWQPLQKLVRRMVFRADRTRLPFLATEVVVVATRKAP